ncbi:aldehyde dehydrogenase family protein [Homoserinibacter sp. YIM 151385]|uniref:aldehyde dehydrogenase family protein n=1 Tax=Homoserinibacter sp. YIM 151385 TaxID=2985506 RepID=UPI0022F11680|nr:aldehyde dehydrogenase family protein [Homoserinibacter sp. YIM 151385]WBU37478.1 aldehyde dehydrogenase family protein [Homoserinibacter sp. YIM 151385]
MSEQITTSPLLLAGRWTEGAGGATVDVENPADEGLAGRVAVATEADVESAVREATRAQRAWGATPAVERAAVLLRLAELIERDGERLARIVVSEVGKPIREARGEVGGAANFCRYFAGLATSQGGEIMPAARRDAEVLVRREPIGVVGAIIPWNFPLALTTRKLAPALAAGNAIVLKPAELTPLSALAIAELAIEAGVPEGILSVLPGPGSVIGAAIVRTPGVGLVTMTGSVRAGRSILHGAAERIIPASLELGGKAPFIVFADADLEQAVASAVATRMMNNGQACVCNERTYVEASIHGEFVERYTAALEALVVGDPSAEATEVGPKVSAPELANVERIVDAAVAAGAKLVTGGSRLTGAGYERGHWYAPTLLTEVAADSPVLREEVFGPVTPIVAFADEAEAVRMANDTEFGLSSYLYTNDYGRVMRMTAALESGEVFVNRGGPEEVVGFHAGWGESGLGGDDGTHGFELYSRRKTVYASWGGA